jgi:hypothetical protein
MEAEAEAFGGIDSPKPRKGSKAHLRWEVEQFSKVSAREGCLLNHRQAALLLDVSAARVSELVTLGKLTRYDFLGRTYVCGGPMSPATRSRFAPATRRRANTGLSRSFRICGNRWELRFGLKPVSSDFRGRDFEKPCERPS